MNYAAENKAGKLAEKTIVQNNYRTNSVIGIDIESDMYQYTGKCNSNKQNENQFCPFFLLRGIRKNEQRCNYYYNK